MKAKLTLTIDDKVIEAAKQYAKWRGLSLSEFIEVYLRDVTDLNSEKINSQTAAEESAVYLEKSALPRELEDLAGSVGFDLPDGMTYKQWIRQERFKDYRDDRH